MCNCGFVLYLVIVMKLLTYLLYILNRNFLIVFLFLQEIYYM